MRPARTAATPGGFSRLAIGMRPLVLDQTRECRGSGASPPGPVDRFRHATEKRSHRATRDRRRNADFEHREPRSRRVDMQANDEADDRSTPPARSHSEKPAARWQRLLLDDRSRIASSKCVLDYRAAARPRGGPSTLKLDRSSTLVGEVDAAVCGDAGVGVLRIAITCDRTACLWLFDLEEDRAAEVSCSAEHPAFGGRREWVGTTVSSYRPGHHAWRWTLAGWGQPVDDGWPCGHPGCWDPSEGGEGW